MRALGLVALSEAEPTEALAVLDLVLEVVPDPEMWLRRGRLLERLSQRAEALASYEHAVAIVPEPASLNAWGMLLVRLGRTVEAMPVLARSLLIDPGQTEVRNLIALLRQAPP